MFSQIGAHLDYIFTDQLPKKWLTPNDQGIRRSSVETMAMVPLIHDSKLYGWGSAGLVAVAIISLAASILGGAPTSLTASIPLAALMLSLYLGYKYKETMNELFTKFKCELNPAVPTTSFDSFRYLANS